MSITWERGCFSFLWFLLLCIGPGWALPPFLLLCPLAPNLTFPLPPLHHPPTHIKLSQTRTQPFTLHLFMPTFFGDLNKVSMVSMDKLYPLIQLLIQKKEGWEPWDLCLPVTSPELYCSHLSAKHLSKAIEAS